MTIRNKPAWGALFLLVGAVSLIAPEEAASQGGQDFLFGEPHVSMAFHMGY